MSNTVSLWPYLLLSLGIGVLGSVFTSQGLKSEWYASLDKSSIQPPNWFFAVIWTLIYIILAYAAYSGYRKTGNSMFNVIFALNLFFNVLWCYVFFVVQQPVFSLLIIVLLLLTTVWLMVMLWNVDRPAALWLLVYVGWLFIATYLNWHYAVQLQ